MTVETDFSGNRGEWSEVCALLKILGDGRIYGADHNVKKKPDVYLSVKRIIRKEKDNELTFIRIPEESKVLVIRNGVNYVETTFEELYLQYGRLLVEIGNNTGTFQIRWAEDYLRKMGFTKLKSQTYKKSNIQLVIEDSESGKEITRGFGIISMLGNPSTLINASGSSNLIFSLEGNISKEIADTANHYRNSDSGTKVVDMLVYLKNQGIGLHYLTTENKILENNLLQIDSKLPIVLGEMLILYYRDGISNLAEQLCRLGEMDPLNLKSGDAQYPYECMVCKLLLAYSRGMQSSKPWTESEDSNSGFIIVRRDGEILCYQIEDASSFEYFLIKNTKFDTPSINRHKFAYVYFENGCYKLKLNMQVRFI